MTEIQWELLAEPQASGYDSEVILEDAWDRWGYDVEVVDSGFCGRVPVEPLPYSIDPTIIDADIDDPRIKGIDEALSAWPEGYLAVQQFCGVFHPLDQDPPMPDGARGSTSGHFYPGRDDHLGVYVTIYDTIGCAEGIVHEVGHNRLHALGIDIEGHDGSLITNPPDELYESPIRKDKLRPMSAVLQAQYSYVMVSSLDVALEATEYLKINIPRIEEGLSTLKSHCRTTDEGGRFMNGFYEWTERTIDRGNSILADLA